MLCTDRIVVLSHTRFSDSSIIVQALSRQHGRISLMVYGFGGKNRSKMGAFHPMSLLDVVYSYKSEREVQKLTEYKPSPNLVNCTTDIRKSTLLMFMAEVVSKSIREEAEDDAQFEFIDMSVQILEQMQMGLQFFHLAFMVKLSRILGFFPSIDSNHQFFDLEQGHSTAMRPVHRHFVAADVFNRIVFFADCQYNCLCDIQMSRQERDFMLETVIKWYQFRIPTMKDVNSYEILREVFSA
jgi:DNA repair protein RecO (recombination protein O)